MKSLSKIMSKIKLPKLPQQLQKFREALTALAGLAAQGVALGVLHGNALTAAQWVLGVATVLGVHAASKVQDQAAPSA